MKLRLIGLFAICLLGTAVVRAALVAQEGVQPQPIPPGFDFPADEATLLRYRDTQNVTEMRKHGWNVFAGLVQPSPTGEAIWETWHSGAETFQPGPSPQGARRPQRRFTAPRQFESGGAAPQAVGDSLLSFTLFSATARTHIRSNGLHLPDELTKRNQAFASTTPTDERKVPDFPRDAMSIKTTWWLVKRQGLTPLPIWDFEPTKTDLQGNPFPTWKRAVAVDPLRTTIPSGETANIAFNGPKPGSRVVPLAKFYSFTIAAEDLATIQKVGGFESAAVGDHAALVGLHYTTKEIPDWVWATFWWHDRPDDGPYGMGRTSNVTGVWANYLMDIAFSMDTPREFDGTADAVYNPWLEARFSNGMASNCMTCHQRAVWPDLQDDPTKASFLPVTRGTLAATAPRFASRMKLDFFWSFIYEPRQ